MTTPALACPACGGHLTRLTLPVAGPPVELFEATAEAPHVTRLVAPKGALLCDRCEWAEDIDTIVRGTK